MHGIAGRILLSSLVVRKQKQFKKAMAEIDIPEVMNEKLIITVSVEGRLGKRK